MAYVKVCEEAGRETLLVSLEVDDRGHLPRPTPLIGT